MVTKKIRRFRISIKGEDYPIYWVWGKNKQAALIKLIKDNPKLTDKELVTIIEK